MASPPLNESSYLYRKVLFKLSISLPKVTTTMRNYWKQCPSLKKMFMKEMQLKFLLIIIRSLQLGFCWCLAHDKDIWKKYKKSGNHCLICSKK